MLNSNFTLTLNFHSTIRNHTHELGCGFLPLHQMNFNSYRLPCPNYLLENNFLSSGLAGCCGYERPGYDDYYDYYDHHGYYDRGYGRKRGVYARKTRRPTANQRHHDDNKNVRVKITGAGARTTSKRASSSRREAPETR